MHLEELAFSGARETLRWTSTGTNLDPGGAGNGVVMVGRERLRLTPQASIFTSEAEFRRSASGVR